MLQFVLLNISRSGFCITKVMFFSYKTNDKKEVFTTSSYLFKRSDLPYIVVFYSLLNTRNSKSLSIRV